MLRWLGPRKAPEPPDGQADRPPEDEEDGGRRGEEVTDDPLASAFGPDYQRHRRRVGGGGGGNKEGHHHQIYSVSRSVLLPRVSLLKNTTTTTSSSAAGNTASSGANNTTNTAINIDADGLGTSALIGGGVNPLFQDPGSPISQSQKSKPQQAATRRNSPQGRATNSSGYGSSQISLDEPYPPPSSSKLRDDAVTILEQNPNFVKSIKIATASKRKPPSSSSSGTLTTIPEGKVDSPIPKPIWPRDQYDSIVDDALLLYTSLNYVPGGEKSLEYHLDVSVKELLVDLLNNINATIEGTTGKTPEEMLKMVNEKIALSIETLKISTEEEMKKLCLNLSNCKKLNSVLRAFSSTSSGHSTGSSRNSPEWSSSSNGRVRTSSGTETSVDDIYQIPSGSSSSGFSDFPPNAALPIFIHEDIGSVPNGVRNAMIYGTLYRAAKNAGVKGHQGQNREQLLAGSGSGGNIVKKSSLRAMNDNKPSVWEQYYGVKAQQDVVPGGKCVTPKPTDVPLFPGGRPEADFTLDVPRSELLSRRMKEDKKWRCRCRLLTSFLGLVFFLLSVMAVSLMLTRGKRMFGSMM